LFFDLVGLAVEGSRVDSDRHGAFPAHIEFVAGPSNSGIFRQTPYWLEEKKR